MGDTDLDTLLAKVAATPRRPAPPRLGGGTERYELRRRLGRGGFGDVYEARDRQHGTLVALKHLKRTEPGWLYRFKREFRMVADLSHPNIVRLYELFCEQDRWYLTMELIDGLPFAEHVTRAPEDMRSCFAQLAMAIAALHQSGCLHRDIKPSNALVEPSGRVVLLDFGLARQRAGALHTAVAGTPPYMAPEIGMGNEPSEASDWYAFGVMLYQALAGRLPYDGSESEIFQGKIAGPPPRASIRRPGNDPVLEALALELLQPDPSSRPSGDELLAAIAAPGASGRKRSPVDAAGPGVVGRDRELAVLVDALARSADGGVLATVHGLPGIGKSTLARALAEHAAGAGARFFEGRCLESESLPFKGLDGVIDRVCEELLALPDGEVAELVPAGAGALVRMFPVLKRVRELARAHAESDAMVTPHAARRAARGALRELLTRLARRAPVVVFLDDLQWANDDSVNMLLDLLADPAPPILTVVAYRRDGADPGGPLDRFLASAAGWDERRRVELAIEPLDRSGVEALLATRPELAMEVDAALRETGGHPYLLARLVGAGALRTGDAPDLAAVLGAQIAGLAGPPRALLEVVCLSASALSQRAAFAVSGESWSPIAVDELRREKLVLCTTTSADGIIEPYHTRVREAVLAGMPPDRRRELHAMLASFLETRGRAEPEALVHHYRHAGHHELALKWTRAAARNARDALAFARATELFRDALELATDDALRLELLVELAEAYVRAGRRTDAGRTYLQAAELAAQLGDAQLVSAMRTLAGEHFVLAGHIKRGIGLLRDALADVGVALPGDTATSVAATITVGAALATRGLAFTRQPEDALPPRQLRRLDLQLAVGRALALTDVRASWVTSRALLEALDAGEPHRVALAMAYFAFSNCARAADHPMIVECVAQARALADELDDEFARAWAALAAGMWHAQRAEFLIAVDALRDAQRRFLAHGYEHAREAAIAHVAQLVLLGNYGVDLPRALREHGPCLDDAIERDDLFAANWGRVMLSWITLARGDHAAARAQLAGARDSWPAANEELFAATVLVNEIAIDLYADEATAWATVERVRPAFEALYSSLIPVTRNVFQRLASSSALAAYAAGAATRAETVARIAPAVDIVREWSYGLPMNLAVEAFLRIAEGDGAAYEALMRRAAERWHEQAQRGAVLAARLRIHQFRGERAEAEAVTAELRAFGVAEPDRFALLFAGPKIGSGVGRD